MTMSFMKPYQKSTRKTVHRASRKAKFSATVGYLNTKRYVESKRSDVEMRCSTTTVDHETC